MDWPLCSTRRFLLSAPFIWENESSKKGNGCKAQEKQSQECHTGPQVRETTHVWCVFVHSGCSVVPPRLPHVLGFKQLSPSPPLKTSLQAVFTNPIPAPVMRWGHLHGQPQGNFLWRFTSEQRKLTRYLQDSIRNKHWPPGQMSSQVLWELDVTFQQSQPWRGCLVITHARQLQAEHKDN